MKNHENATNEETSFNFSNTEIPHFNKPHEEKNNLDSIELHHRQYNRNSQQGLSTKNSNMGVNTKNLNFDSTDTRKTHITEEEGVPYPGGYGTLEEQTRKLKSYMNDPQHYSTPQSESHLRKLLKRKTINDIEYHIRNMMESVCDEKKLNQLTEVHLSSLVKHITDNVVDTLTSPLELIYNPSSLLQDGIHVLSNSFPQSSFLLWLNHVGKNNVVKAMKENLNYNLALGEHDNINKTFTNELKHFIEKYKQVEHDEFLSIYRSLLTEIVEAGLNH